MRMSESEYQDFLNKRAASIKDVGHALGMPPSQKRALELAESMTPDHCKPLRIAVVPQQGKKPVRAKYGNHKVVIDGITFDSKKEGERYNQLRMMECAGKIHCLKMQVPFILAPAIQIHGRTKPALRYFADFQYFEADALQYTLEDVKSEITRKDPVYRIKIHLMKSVHNLDVVEI